MSNRLFYTESDKTLFMVPNYYVDSGDSSVQSMIKKLTKHEQELLKTLSPSMLEKNKELVVETYLIEHSSRYKHMRVFFISTVEPNNCPKEAYFISEFETDGNDKVKLDENKKPIPRGWSMHKWIHN